MNQDSDGTNGEATQDRYSAATTLTDPPPPSGQPFAVGTNGGNTATVTLFNPDRSVRFSVTPFGASYTGVVRLAVGDVTGDGIVDVVAVTDGNVSIPARVAVIHGITGAVVSTPSLIPSTYIGALSVAVGDVTGDGIADIALGTNESVPRVRMYRGGAFSPLVDFAVDGTSGFRGLTNVALGDITGDGRADLVVTARQKTKTRVYGFIGTSLVPGATPRKAFSSFALGGSFANGINVAVGDVNGDGRADLILGTCSSSSPRVNVYSGRSLTDTSTLSKIADFSPAHGSGVTGVAVAARDIDGDGVSDIVTSSGEIVSAFKGGVGLPPSGRPALLFAFDPAPALNGGVWVG
jgi:hypothetical protein